jgi:hypothetical protein
MASKLFKEQEELIVALYEKLKRVQDWYWEHLATWRKHLLEAAAAAEAARAAFREVDAATRTVPPWLEGAEDRELLRRPGTADIPVGDGGIPEGWVVERELTEAEGFEVEGLGWIYEETTALMKGVYATLKLAESIEETTAELRLVAGDLMSPTRRARRADPEVALALVIHRRTGIAIDWIQEALDERFRPEGRTPGKLAEKVRALEKRLRTDEKSGR